MYVYVAVVAIVKQRRGSSRELSLLSTILLLFLIINVTASKPCWWLEGKRAPVCIQDNWSWADYSKRTHTPAHTSTLYTLYKKLNRQMRMAEEDSSERRESMAGLCLGTRKVLRLYLKDKDLRGLNQVASSGKCFNGRSAKKSYSTISLSGACSHHPVLHGSALAHLNSHWSEGLEGCSQRVRGGVEDW